MERASLRLRRRLSIFLPSDKKLPVGIQACALSALLLGLWFGFQMVYAALNGSRACLVLRILSLAGSISFIACYFGLRRRTLWSWFLFLALAINMLLQNLVAAYVFLYRVSHGRIFSISYEVLGGITLATLVSVPLVSVWYLTGPAAWSQFETHTGAHRGKASLNTKQELWLGGILTVASSVFLLENALTSEIGWVLALALISVAAGVCWIILITRSRIQTTGSGKGTP